MQRKYVLPFVVALLVLSAGCVGALQPNPSALGAQQTATDTTGDGWYDGPTVSVSSSGQVDAAPDLAVVNLAVVARADSADEARQQVAAGVESMRQALRDAGVADDAVSSSGYHLSLEYDYTGEKREVVGYRAIHSFTVELDDVDRAGEVIDVAVSNGATSVNGVHFTLSDDRRQALRAQAIEEAMQHARSDAEAIAGAGDLDLTGIVSVSTTNVGYPGPIYAERGDAADGGGATTIEPGTVTVSATVSVVYGAD